VRVALLILIGAACAFSASSGQADRVTPSAELVQLQTRLARLEAREDAVYATGALEQARRALRSASGSAEDDERVSRAEGIARAAMVLAESQLERRRSQQDLAAIQARLQAIRQQADAQRRTLEALMRDRASLARQEAQP
jgi:hypothetical protein